MTKVSSADLSWLHFAAVRTLQVIWLIISCEAFVLCHDLQSPWIIITKLHAALLIMVPQQSTASQSQLGTLLTDCMRLDTCPNDATDFCITLTDCKGVHNPRALSSPHAVMFDIEGQTIIKRSTGVQCPHSTCMLH